jgi:hypothetical protein
MSKYLFRMGDGNEGNFPRFVVELGKRDCPYCPYSALRALVANEYIAGRSVHAGVYEGPHGETAFGAAWLTAELQPADDDEDDECYAIRKLLDPAALRLYRAEMKAA